MNDDYKPSSPTAQLGGAKQKNGHKAQCCCHICENIKNKAKRGGYEEDAAKAQLKRMGGPKKKNGHKPNCECPICKNMKNAKKGGYTEGETEGEYNQIDKNDSNITGGKYGKKSNGHKANCQCPICKNMRKKPHKGGNTEPDFENQIENQIDNIKEGKEMGDNEMPASNQEYDELEAMEKEEVVPGISLGGTRKRRRTNRNKSITKNMKNKTRRYRKRSNRRR
jgi:hypothetical protein